MEVALALLIAIIAVVLLGAWYYALWRGWGHASRDQTRAERRLAVSGVAVLLLLPVALAVGGASDGTATVAIAIGMAGVLPALIIVGVRDHRRRERRIRARRHGTSDGNE
jgi:peptidoglycan/LPS O-acetylase OafA/YrhL